MPPLLERKNNYYFEIRFVAGSPEMARLALKELSDDLLVELAEVETTWDSEGGWSGDYLLKGPVSLPWPGTLYDYDEIQARTWLPLRVYWWLRGATDAFFDIRYRKNHVTKGYSDSWDRGYTWMLRRLTL